jgi:hypothetical protein
MTVWRTPVPSARVIARARMRLGKERKMSVTRMIVTDVAAPIVPGLS